MKELKKTQRTLLLELLQEEIRMIDKWRFLLDEAQEDMVDYYEIKLHISEKNKDIIIEMLESNSIDN